MPATLRTRPRLRFAMTPAVLLAAAVGLTVQAQPPDTKKAAEAKPATAESSVVKLPDGTFLWVGNPGTGDERVSLTPQELQKLQDQIDQLKKQLADRKAVPPSGCAIRARVEKRGDQPVAVVKVVCTFRTTAARTVIALGGRKAFLLAATLDGNKVPVLETTDDGFAALIETPGDHALTLELEAPVAGRGAKPELGFELGLPRAPITTLVFDPPGADIKRVNLTTRTLDPAFPLRPLEPRRIAALDAKQLAPRPGQEGGYPLGPADSVEVGWDPPAAAAIQPADQVQSAELDVSVLLTEGVVETTAKIRLRGPTRVWKIVAPAAAAVSVDRATGAADVGPSLPPAIAKPADTNKPAWKVEFPTGSAPTDWVVTAVTRQSRAMPDDPKHRGPFPVGPFAVLDVLRQTGTVRVTAPVNTRFAFRHGPDLRRAEVPGPHEDDVSGAFFRLTTGPTGATPVNAPLLAVEAVPLAGRVAVKPAYKLVLTEAGWKVRAEVKVFPIRTEIDSVAVEIPAEWRGLEASPAELVDGVQQESIPEGFWAALAARLSGGVRVPVIVRLAARHKQPFDLVLTATVPVPAGATEAAIPLPRFPNTEIPEATLAATVTEGLDLRGEAREWEGQYPAAWGHALAPASEPNGTPKGVTAIAGRADRGIASAALGWQPHRLDLSAEIRADITIADRQVVVQQVIKLRSPDGFPRPIRFRGPSTATGLTARPALEALRPGEWGFAAAPDAREVILTLAFAVPLPVRTGADSPEGKIPAGIIWPAAATRTEATVRVWSNSSSGRSVSNATGGWRELPVEPVPERDALPALVLYSSGGEAPLVLELRDPADGAAVAVWVDRGLIQASVADDGTARCRARFLLRRWLAPTIEIRLPGPATGTTPDFYIDGKKIDVVPGTFAAATDRGFRVPLPEPRPGRVVVVEVRYQLPAQPDSTVQPALLSASAFTGPVRWHVAGPAGSLPLLINGAIPEVRWRWRSGLFAATAAGSADELEQWFKTGADPNGEDDGDAVAARQMAPAVITVYHVPRVGFVVACSSVAFVVIFVCARLPAAAAGPVVAMLAATAGVAAIYLPHVAAQAAGATQPGLAAAVGVALVWGAARSYYRRQVLRLPGFTRTFPAGSAAAVAMPSSARVRTSAHGTADPSPVAPAGE